MNKYFIVAKRKSREITPGVVQTGTYIFANGDKYGRCNYLSTRLSMIMLPYWQ